MFKFKSLALIPILLSLKAGSNVESKLYSAALNGLVVEPLSLTNQTSRLFFNFRRLGTGYRDITIEIVIKNDLYPSGKVIYSYVDSNNKSLNLSCKYNNQYTRPGINNITFNLINGNLSKSFSVDAVIGQSQTYAINEDNNVISGLYPLETYLSDWSYTYPVFTFDGFYSNYMPDLNSSFNLDGFSILTNSTDIHLEETTAYLHLKDNSNFYCYMPKQGNYLKVPLNVYEKGKKTFGLELANIYYVDPLSLQMSQSKRLGYVETSTVFLEKGEGGSAKYCDGMIVFDNFGITNDRVVYSFTIGTSMNVIGDCQNSEYCVVTYDGTLNDYGWLI